MKKIKLLIIILICFLTINVKADAGAPSIISHNVVVTNKNGAQCYESPNGKKEDRVIKHGTTLKVYTDIEGKYIYVDGGGFGCYVKYADVSSKTQSFDMNNDEVEKITPQKAIILAGGGLNLRKGPSVTYSAITTIPQNTVITVTHTGGSYWYYTEYNGKSGWVSSINGYLGFEKPEVLINYENVKIYDSNEKTVLGTIPANTEITDYIQVSDDYRYYVIYNGIKGYINNNMLYKIDSPGKIKLVKDYVIEDDNGKPIKKLTAGQELEYTMVGIGNDFYFPDKKEVLYVSDDFIEYITKANKSVKTRGYLGEGLFGEEKIENNSTATPIPESEDIKEKNNKGMSTRDLIIICLLGGIFLALTALVIIKLVNSKNKVDKKVVNQAVKNEEEKKENNKNE